MKIIYFNSKKKFKSNLKFEHFSKININGLNQVFIEILSIF